MGTHSECHLVIYYKFNLKVYTVIVVPLLIYPNYS